MPPLTAQGKAIAIEGLRRRREAAKTQKVIRNEELYAGSPMYYFCNACGLQNIVLPESHIQMPPRLCNECSALKELGWLE